jgi:Gpi18-like mannosyltransferase
VPIPGTSTAHTLSVLSFWDGVWYRRVAEHGYLLVPGRQSDPAFFPLFPIVLRALRWLDFSFLTTGILVANVAFVIGIVAFYELSRRIVPGEVARTSALLAAFFPMSFVFSMTYPKSLVLAALAIALLLALVNHWTLSAMAGAAAALGRPEAIFFALPLAVVAIGCGRSSGRRAHGQAIGAAVAPVASIGAFPLYLGWALHDVSAWNGLSVPGGGPSALMELRTPSSSSTSAGRARGFGGTQPSA